MVAASQTANRSLDRFSGATSCPLSLGDRMALHCGASVIAVIEFAGFKEYGEYAARLQDDPEARALLQSAYTDRDPIVVSQTIELVREL